MDHMFTLTGTTLTVHLPSEVDHHSTELLHLLKEEERRLIELRYFDDLTQVQTAGALGMTQVQVSRAEKRILRKMRLEIV